jgi:hypothetical protein
MSLFDLATSPQKASDFAKQMRIQEFKSDGGNLTGNLKFRFTASENQHWIPSASYILMKFAIGKGAAGTTALVAADAVNLAQNPGACAVSAAPVLHTINGINVGTASMPAQSAQVLDRMFMSNEVRNTVGDIKNLTASRTDNLIGTTLHTCFIPPLGLWYYGGAIPGGNHQLQFTMSSNLIQDMVKSNDAGAGTGRSTAGLTFNLVDISLFAAFAQPQADLKPPSTVMLNLTECQTQTAHHSVNGSATVSVSQPASTKKVAIATQRSDLSNAAAGGASTFTGLSITSGPSCEAFGQTSPTTLYSEADHHRKYTDLYLNSLMSGRSVYSTLVEWATEPMTLHPFAKSSDSVDTNMLIRFTGDGATTPSNILISSIYSAMVVLSYGGDGQVTGVQYSVVS